jgi:hypothetical protein
MRRDPGRVNPDRHSARAGFSGPASFLLVLGNAMEMPEQGYRIHFDCGPAKEVDWLS